jgi:heme-degrading monooxygenase HmoA
MYVVIFRATIKKLDKEYRSLAEKMRELAFSKYGCIDFISITEGDQEIALSYWESEDQIKEWKEDNQHMQAQELGKREWYKD